ncbi:MAG: hypothetical protein RL322_1412 [Pseudomonadota bacterium]|jgi:2-hydroxychromene-2-carboxylate isomerase
MAEPDPAPIECFYSVRSVYAYFGLPRIALLARQYGRRLIHRPIDLSRVVPAFGSQPFGERGARGRALQFRTEVWRWSQFLDMPVRLEPVHHHGDRNLPSCFILAAQEEGLDADALAVALLTALWRDDQDIADPAVLQSIAAGCGADGESLRVRAQSARLQDAFEACTQRAIDNGVPGSPSFLVDGELFYGQDRLMFVERHLSRPFRPLS